MKIILPIISKKNLIPALLTGYVIFMVCYFAPVHLGWRTPTRLSYSPWDQRIPFLGWTIWIYISQYVFVLIATCYANNDKTRTEVFYAAMLTCMLASFVFFVFPTTLPRETIMGTGVDPTLWKFLYFTDTDTNCMPSLHVALAILSMLMLKDAGRFWRRLSIVWSLLIIISTLTTKQHIIVDGICGAVLALLCYKTVQFFFSPYRQSLSYV